MAVWDDVVECVDVSVLVLEPTGDLECVGDAVCVFEIEADAETVDVILGVNDMAAVPVPETVEVDVFDWELDFVFVGEVVWDLEPMELKEFVRVWIWDLDSLEVSV